MNIELTAEDKTFIENLSYLLKENRIAEFCKNGGATADIHVGNMMIALQSSKFDLWGITNNIVVPYMFCRTTAETVELPEGITRIGNNAFVKSEITKITIPDSVIKIDYRAFAFCKSLSRVFLADSVRFIGKDCFRDCNENIKIITNRRTKANKLNVPPDEVEWYKKHLVEPME